MRKEIIFAIIAGIVFGLILALGVWRANSALEKSPEIITTDSDESTKDVTFNGELTISKPDNGDVFTNTPIVLNGITAPNTWVAVSAETTQYTTLSNNVGEFEFEVELEDGLNRILVSAFITDQAPQEQIIAVVYSSEFNTIQEDETE